MLSFFSVAVSSALLAASFTSLPSTNRPLAIALQTMRQSSPLPSHGIANLEQTLYAFQGSPDGRFPGSDLVPSGNGSLLGMTVAGGTSTCLSDAEAGCGTIFSITPSASGATEHILYQFAGGSDGAAPFGTLVPDGTGVFYGLTSVGGFENNGCTFASVTGCGTLYKLTPSGTGAYQESIVYRFFADDGSLPAGRLLRTQSGSLLGISSSGGIYRWGNVFEFLPAGNGFLYRSLYDFKNSADGIFPDGGLIEGKNGVLFGTTQLGGQYANGCFSSGDSCGTIFMLTPSGSGYTKQTIYQFQGGADGFWPVGPLLVDSSGTLYGVTLQGGRFKGICSKLGGCGTVFTLTPSSSGYQHRVIFAFNGADGVSPSSALLKVKGSFYGETDRGGRLLGCTNGCGTIYRLSPAGSSYKENVIYSFLGGIDGAHPENGLLVQGGNLLGTTLAGGSSCNCGTVFSLPLR